MLNRLKTKQIPNPLEAELAEIERVWGPSGWYVTAHDYGLRDNPDVAYHAQRRAEARAIAEARKAELVAAALARGRHHE